MADLQLSPISQMPFLSPPRALVVTNILTPYKVPVFDKLAASEEINVQVWFMADSEGNRRWSFDSKGPRVRIFRDFGVDLSSSGVPVIHFNPGMLYRLAKTRPEVVILGGYSSITCLLAAPLLECSTFLS